MINKFVIARLFGVIIFLFFIANKALALPPPPPDPTPIGGGIFILIVAGVIYGGSKLYKHKRK